MVLNPSKCNYNLTSDKNPSHKIILDNNDVASCNEEKLLVILLESKSNFDSDIASLCK